MSRQNICLISYRHAGILAAVQNEYLDWQPSYAYHVYCLHHVTSNFNTRFKDLRLRDMLKRTGMQTQLKKFNKYMRKIEKMNSEAFQWLTEILVDKWSLAHDGGRRFGMMTTNLFECFNGVLKNAHFLLVTSLVQLIFFRLVSYFDDRHAQAEDALNRDERFILFAITRVISNQSKATSHNITRFDRTGGLFQVQTVFYEPYINKDNNTQMNSNAKPSFYDHAVIYNK